LVGSDDKVKVFAGKAEEELDGEGSQKKRGDSRKKGDSHLCSRKWWTALDIKIYAGS